MRTVGTGLKAGAYGGPEGPPYIAPESRVLM